MTVCTDMYSFSAISLFVNPFTTWIMISFSRWLSWSPLSDVESLLCSTRRSMVEAIEATSSLMDIVASNALISSLFITEDIIAMNLVDEDISLSESISLLRQI